MADATPAVGRTAFAELVAGLALGAILPAPRIG